MLEHYEEEKGAIYLDQIPSYSGKESFKKYMIECEHFKEMYLTASEGGEDLAALRALAKPLQADVVRGRKEVVASSKVSKAKRRIIGSFPDFVLFHLKTVYISLRFAHICLFPAAYRFVPGWSPSKNLVCILTLQVFTFVRI